MASLGPDNINFEPLSKKLLEAPQRAMKRAESPCTQDQTGHYTSNPSLSGPVNKNIPLFGGHGQCLAFPC